MGGPGPALRTSGIRGVTSPPFRVSVAFPQPPENLPTFWARGVDEFGPEIVTDHDGAHAMPSTRSRRNL